MPADGTLAAVDAPPIAIHLDVRLDGGTPVGQACDERGHTREFAGWVGLVAAVDALLEATSAGHPVHRENR